MPREPARFPTEVLRTPPITSTTPSSPQPTEWEHRGRGFPTGGQVNVMALVLPTSVCHLGPPPSALPPYPQDRTKLPPSPRPPAPAPRTPGGRFLPRGDVPAAPAHGRPRCQPSPLRVHARRSPSRRWGPRGSPAPSRPAGNPSAAPRLLPAPLRSPGPRPARAPTHAGGSEGSLRLASEESRWEESVLRCCFL